MLKLSRIAQGARQEGLYILTTRAQTFFTPQNRLSDIVPLLKYYQFDAGY